MIISQWKPFFKHKDLEQMYRHIAEPIKPQITIKGLEYLAKNSFMGKAQGSFEDGRRDNLTKTEYQEKEQRKLSALF